MELDLPASISSFFKYLFCLQGRVGMRGERNLLSAGSFPQCLQWAEMGQATATEWRYFRVSHVKCGSSSTWAIFCCFFQAICRELHRKWSNWDILQSPVHLRCLCHRCQLHPHHCNTGPSTVDLNTHC